MHVPIHTRANIPAHKHPNTQTGTPIPRTRTHTNTHTHTHTHTHFGVDAMCYSKASKLAIDGGPPSLGVLLGLEHQQSRGLSCCEWYHGMYC